MRQMVPYCKATRVQGRKKSSSEKLKLTDIRTCEGEEKVQQGRGEGEVPKKRPSEGEVVQVKPVEKR